MLSDGFVAPGDQFTPSHKMPAMPDRTPFSKKASKNATTAPATSSFKNEYGTGKTKLLAAAARLVAREGSARLTLRELAKEAGMAHNSIYRHFPSVEVLMSELVEDFTLQLRDGLRLARSQVPDGELPSKVVVGWLLDFALSHRDSFVVAMRERHGPSGPARQAIEEGMTQIMSDMRSDLTAAGRLPPLPDDKLDLAIRMIVQQTFELCLACIEAPEKRTSCLSQAELIFSWCLAGAVAISGQTK